MHTLIVALFLVGNSPVLTAGEKVSVALATRPAKSTFIVYNKAGGVVQKGTTPFIGSLPEGVYRLVIQKDGYYSIQRIWKIQKGKQAILQLELFRKATKPGLRAVAPPPPRRGALLQKKPTSQRAVVRARPQPPAKRKSGSLSTKPPKRRASTSGKAVGKKSGKKKVVKKKIPWLPLAFAGVLGVASGIFWGMSTKELKNSRLKSQFQVEAFREFQDGRSHRSTATFLLVGGAVALGLSGLFYFWPKSPVFGIKKGSKYYDDTPIIGFTHEFR